MNILVNIECTIRIKNKLTRTRHFYVGANMILDRNRTNNSNSNSDLCIRIIRSDNNDMTSHMTSRINIMGKSTTMRTTKITSNRASAIITIDL